MLFTAFFGASLFATGAVGATVALGLLVDDVVIPLVEDEADSSRAVTVLTIVAAVAVGRALGVVVRRYFAGMLQARTKASLQRRAVHRLIQAPLGHLRATPTGQLLAHVDSDADAATEPLAPLPFAVGAVVLVVLAVASLVWIDPLLGLVSATLIPLLWMIQRLHGRYVEQPALDVRRHLGTVAGIAHESFDGALVVKTLGRETDEIERFGAATDRLREARVRQSIVRGVYDQALESLPDLGVVGLVLVAAWRVDSGAITTGQLVQAVAVFGVLAFPIAVAGFFFASLPPGTVARERLDIVFDLPPDRLLSPRSRELLPGGHLGVSMRDVRVADRDGVVLDSISLEVAPGSTVALVGSTGSGKSTIIKALARLTEVTSGTVEIAGFPLDTIDDLSLRSRVSVALQEPFLFGDTVEQNLRLGLDDLADENVDKSLALASAEFVGDLEAGRGTVVGERGVTLSGGQRQRVALARSVLRDPGLLLLDDATSAVDPVVEQRILEQLRSLDTTVIVVAHRMSTIALADEVVFVSGGRVAGVGTHEELLSDPDYAALVQAYETEVAR